MGQEPYSFAFITDPQIGMNSPNGLHAPDSDKARLDVAVRYINENGIDFLILGGDQINDANTENTDPQLDVLEESLSALNVPYYGVMGNHEQGDPAQTYKYVERGLPVRFTLDHKCTSFVGINASWLRGDFGESYQEKEWNYLADGLENAADDCKQRFVAMHWPLLSLHPEEEETYWNMPNRHKILELFKKHDVSCVLSGHWQQDLDTRWQGISFVTSVGTAMPLQYPEELSFKVVTVFDGGWSARRVSVPTK